MCFSLVALFVYMCSAPPNIKNVDHLFDENYKDPHQKNPKNENEEAKWIFEDVVSSCDHGHAAIDELVHAASVKSNVEEHLRGNAVTICSSDLEFNIFIDLVLISYPKGLLVIHTVQQFFQKTLVVKVQV